MNLKDKRLSLYNSYYLKSSNSKLHSNSLKYRRRLIEKFLPINKLDALDLGCGAGDTLCLYSLLGFERVTGVEQLLITNKNISQRNINIINNDIFNFIQHSQASQYDLISMFDVLEHLQPEEVPHILKKCYELLRPGGSLIIQVPNGGSIFLGTIFYGDPTHVFTYNEYSLRKLFISSGFNSNSIIFKETSPKPLTIFSTIRMILWFIIRFFISLMHIVETGSSPKVHTRVIICAAFK